MRSGPKARRVAARAHSLTWPLALCPVRVGYQALPHRAQAVHPCPPKRPKALLPIRLWYLAPVRLTIPLAPTLEHWPPWPTTPVDTPGTPTV